MIPSTTSTLNKSLILAGFILALAAIVIPFRKNTDFSMTSVKATRMAPSKPVILFSGALPVTIYVDSSATGANNGTSWVDAYTTLPPALLTANACDTIWVAAGTYFPGGASRDSSFNIPDSVTLLGGFGGVSAGALASVRNWICNRTILSGDFQEDNDISNNSYHVVTTIAVGTATVVDGFIITEGYADNTGGNGFVKYGGGWFNRGLGGIESSPVIRNCTFTGNQTDIATGGNFGGGAFATFADAGNTNPTFINCILNNNQSQRGGAIRTHSSNSNSCNLTIVNSILSGNLATSSVPDNGEKGGGIYNDGPGSHLQMINSVLSGNHCTAFRQGGAVYNNNFGTSRPTATLVNSIVWNNSPGGNYTYFNLNPGAGDSIQLSYCIVGPAAATYPGTGTFKDVIGNKIGVDPLFVLAPAAGLSAAGDFHLMAASPAIDMGLNSANTFPTDLDNKVRIQGASIEIGAYEITAPLCYLFASQNTAYVDSSASGNNDGTSWANAFTNFQSALSLAGACGVDTILVAKGTYYPADTTYTYDTCTGAILNTLLPDHNATFNIPDSTVTLGGFPIGGGTLDQRDWVCNKTILSGDIDRNGILDTFNSKHVVTTTNVDSATIVDGFCISGGNASEEYTVFPDYVGGGWYDNGSGLLGESFPTIINCIISGNRARIGGGVYCDGFASGNSSPSFINCILSGNFAQDNGGALFNDGQIGTSSPRLVNCVISGNIANTFNGGAMFNSGNSGGVSRPVIINTIFWNNFALGGGHVFYNSEAQPLVRYSVLQGINNLNDASITANFGFFSTTIDGGNNKLEDPLFIFAPPASSAPTTDGNFHVLPLSPAIDMGLNSANTYPTDLDGNARIQNSIIDIGAFESAYFDCTLYTAGVIYVDSSATGANNGTSWVNAFTDLQYALMAARLCLLADTVKVAGGTYYPSGVDTFIIVDPCGVLPDEILPLTPDKTVSFDIRDSLVVLGGYEGVSGDTLAPRDWVCNEVILCGDIDLNGILDTFNSIHVVTTTNVDSSTIVDGVQISGGNASEDYLTYPDYVGGGWYDNGSGAGNGSFPTIINTIISGNRANGGGGFFSDGTFGGNSSATFINCIISGNRGHANGGGLFNDANQLGTSSPQLINCVISGNLAYFFFGGGMYNSGINGGVCAPNIVNTILWNNLAYNNGGTLENSAYHNNAAFPIVSYSILLGNTDVNDVSVGSTENMGAAVDGGFNKFEDPQFIFAPPGDETAPTTAGDFHVKYTSPAIDMGNNAANTHPVDLDGNARIRITTIDIGAYEFLTPDCALYSGVIYVDTSATGANNGTNWDSAFVNLQDAFQVAFFCDIDSIYVAQGVYYPSGPDTIFDRCDLGSIDTIIPADRTISFDITDSMVVLGGFPNGGGTLAERDPQCYKTILCGEIQQDGDNTNNSYHVVTTTQVSDATLIDGFCITDGNANGMAFPDHFGGGWVNDGSGEGGESSPTIVNTVITGNQAVRGGGMFNYGDYGNSSPVLINCIFSDNIATVAGGGMFNLGAANGTSNPTLTNCIVSGNAATNGGGIYNFGTGGTSSPSLINCDLVGNSASSQGGGMYNDGANTTMVNSITWNNSTAFDGVGTFSVTISYSISQVGAIYTDGGNNKADGTDPLFMFAPSFTAAPTAAGDFHVQTGSPAINMGDNAANTYPTDLDGMARIAEAIIDIGPYEKLLNCDTDTLFVMQDGTILSLPVDSLLLDTLPDGCTLLVNGIPYEDTESVPFTCDQYFDSNLDLLLICGCDTIETCTKIVVLIDSFEKNLVCNDLVNISLGNGCLHVVTTDDVLENIMGCRTALYDVELSYPLGTHKFPPANDLLDESHIGYTMVYSVYETLTGNKCWGYLKVEDKLPPLLNCIDDTIACYELPNLPLLAPNADDCYDGKVELISDEWFDYGCDSVLSGYVIRTIQGTDRWGNFRRCTSVISIERTVLDSVECPDVVELPCEIRYQIGGVIIHPLSLKTPIVVNQSKVTPEFLLSLQKPIWDLFDPITKATSKGWVLNPIVQVVPQIQGQNIYPGAAGICKISSTYKDTRLDVCGAGFKIYREWTIVDWCTQQDTICGQYIKVMDTEAPVLLDELSTLFYDASPHECLASVTIPALIPGTDFRDCNLVNQTYILQYDDPSHPGKIVVLTGSLPSKPLLLPTDSFYVSITLTDLCNNRTTTSRNIFVYDITPPTPVCDEFTQVTLDPVTCWARIAAKDLDNGSRDNCCGVLHFAAASMDSITYWTSYWNTKLETEVGKEAFWHDKAYYDALIEDWINCYVFADSIQLTECGNSQIVLRVYEACGVPKRDPHIFPCSEHAWFCYNTYLYIGDFNFNWFDPNGPHSCTYRPELTSLAKMDLRYIGYETKGYLKPKYVGAAQFIYCDVPFYFPVLANSSGGSLVPGTYCSSRQYSDCMINVLVDDKQAPVVAELEDVIVYCDRAPENAYAPNCMGGEEFNVWPGLLKDKKGVEHGYYGGSDFLGIHQDEHETGDPCGYDNAHHWAPIYCRSWLYLDSFDSAGKIDPKQYFETLVLFDKTRATRTLLAKEFSITDNCRLNDTTLKMSDEGSLNGCGEGWIQRTWTIQDKCGNTVTAKQKVVVKHRSDFEVIFPEDKVVECDFLNTTDPKDAGEPMISDDECEQVGVQYKDEVFTVEDSACYKIVRTWTLIDWCIYNPNAQFHYSDVIVDDRLRADTGNRSCVYRHLKDNNDGYMKYIQVIKVIDKVAPAVTTRDTTICIYSEDCKSALVRIPFNATDNCTATSELSYRVEVDLNATSTVFTNRTYVKSSIDQTTQSNQVEFVYSPSVAGKHVVHVIVKDNCGNEDTSSYRFELVDCKKPTPYCYNGVATVIMPSNSKITVWAKDLDAGSLDNCTLAANLKFSFSSNSSETSKEFTCADIPDGKSKTIPVEIWVTDEAGNQDHCSTYILLQDNSGNVCPDVAGLSVTIAGKIQTETNEPVEHVRVNIYGGALQMNYQTGIKGTYHFEGLPSKSNYSLKSTRDDQPMNGVSTLDLVLIQKHILGIELLDSPYKILAADVDNDKQITAIDLVELRKLILATYEDLPNNESWRFIPKSTTFSDPQNPWNAGAVSEVLEMKEVTTDYKSEDFIGLKVGDVNATAAPHSLMGVEVRGNETGLLFEVTDQVFNRGDVVRVDFRSPNFRGISGWQGTLNISNQLSVVSSQWSVVSGQFEPGVLNLTNQNIGMKYAKEGKITMSWNTNAKSGLDFDDQQVLFTLVFKAQENGKLSEVLRIGSQHTIAESYQGKGELGNLGIRFVQNGNEIVAKSELYQNYPNPFDQRTVIGINLAGQGKGTLKVYDATGRTIKSVERDWTKGYHEVWFDRREIGSTGVLYYRFESGFFNASKKMIILD